jgi:hypothetical protein
MFKKVAFTMYPVTDVARARKFYEETFGLAVRARGRHPPAGESADRRPGPRPRVRRAAADE